MQRAIIYFKNGRKDWIDPVVDVIQTDTTITIDNGYNFYEFQKSEVDHIEYEEMEETINNEHNQ